MEAQYGSLLKVRLALGAFDKAVRASQCRKISRPDSSDGLSVKDSILPIVDAHRSEKSHPLTERKVNGLGDFRKLGMMIRL